MSKRKVLQSTQKETTQVLWLKELSQKDSVLVGEKIALLGDISHVLSKKGIKVPDGFVLPAGVYWDMLVETGLRKEMKILLRDLDITDTKQTKKISQTIRTLLLQQSLSPSVQKDITASYKVVKSKHKKMPSVTVRSSAVCENTVLDMPLGKYDSVLHVTSLAQLMQAVKTCFASLFSVEAIIHREQLGIDHLSVRMAVLVQGTIDASMATSGTVTTVDTSSGFQGVSYVTARYGYDMYGVQNESDSDQWCLFKDGVLRGKQAIIRRTVGKKAETVILSPSKGTKSTKTPKRAQSISTLSSSDVVQLASWGHLIESQLGAPQRVTWVQDSRTKEFYIVQVEPILSQTELRGAVVEAHALKQTGKVLLHGHAVGKRIGVGTVHVIDTVADVKKFVPGEVLVVREMRPEFESLFSKASAIVLGTGTVSGRGATRARELGVPLIIADEKMLRVLKHGKPVTIDCTHANQGVVYSGILPFEVQRTELKDVPQTHTKTMLHMSDPRTAFQLSALPHDGVGLAREEQMLVHDMQVHPLALVHYKKLKDKQAKKKIQALTVGYKDKTEYGIQILAEGIGTLATAVYPKPLVLRLSDIPTHEFASLIGGKEFEPTERNALLGLRGASRYYSHQYKEAFGIHCKAIKRVREEWGLGNVVVMVPFCRTPEEGEMVLNAMESFGLVRGKDGLEVHVMCEIPSNVILAEEFAKMFDGFSIGSGDLTQLTLGIDKESTALSHMYNEQHPAVKKLIADVIAVAQKHKKKVGMCGQAPSDSTAFTEFLVQCGIDSISFNPDVLIEEKQAISLLERTVGRTGKRTNKTMLSLVTVIGLLGAGIVSLGAGCGGVLPATPTVGVSEISPAQMRHMVEEKVLEMRAQELASDTKKLFVDDFADFRVSYPVSWNIHQWRGGITLDDPMSDAFVTIAEQLVPVSAGVGVPVTIGGVQGIQYDVTLNTGQQVRLVELQYDNTIVQVSGSIDAFQAIIGTLDFVSSTSPTISEGRPLNEWDIKEKRLCAQVITYAKERPDAVCTAFPSPCEVPGGWTVCST